MLSIWFSFLLFLWFGLSPGDILGEVGVLVPFSRRDAEDIVLVVFEIGSILEEALLIGAPGIYPPYAGTAGWSPDSFQRSPAAEIEGTLTFSDQLDDPFLFDGVEEVLVGSGL